MVSKVNPSIIFSSIDDSSLEVASVIQSYLKGSRKLSAEEVVGILSQEPELNKLYQLSAGVGEGYTVEEHTRMVVESFEKEFMERSEIQMILQYVGLSSEEFMLFLALHDIGKGRAVEEIFYVCPKRKELELQYTQEVIQKIAERFQLKRESVLIFLELLRDDAIGDLLKNRNPSNADIAAIKELICVAARECGVDSFRFLELKTLFHQVDAASYPFLRERFFQSDSQRQIRLGESVVGRYIDYCQSNLDKMQRLKSVFSQGSSSHGQFFY